MTFSIELKDHWRQGWPVLLFLLWVPLIVLYISYRFGPEALALSIIVATILILPTIIPTVLLHIRYSQINHKTRLNYEPHTRKFLISNSTKRVRFSANEIRFAYSVISLAEARRGWTVFPWQSYSFTALVLKSGKRLILTSLIVPLRKWLDIVPARKPIRDILAWPTGISGDIQST